MEMTDQEFEVLLGACCEIAELFPEGVVFIGGIAVYLHCINHKQASAFAEFTHDADFYISMADMADLRDIEEVTVNRRLSKHQLIKKGFEFDIYTERHSSLLVPFDEVISHARRYGAMNVACLEHLLVLKLEAYLDRKHSAKGQKDAKDIIRLGLVAANSGKMLRPNLCVGYLRDDHLQLLTAVAKGPEFVALAKGNAKVAKSLRDAFSKATQSLVK